MHMRLFVLILLAGALTACRRNPEDDAVSDPSPPPAAAMSRQHQSLDEGLKQLDAELAAAMGGNLDGDDAKNRLLAVWRARGAVAQERGGHRGYDHVQLYLALARMGLKQQAGKIEQRYMGPTFAGIWNEVTPATPADICDLSTHDLSNRYRKL